MIPHPLPGTASQQAVDRPHPEIERLDNRLAGHRAGRQGIERTFFLAGRQREVVERLTEGIQNPAEQLVADRQCGTVAHHLDQAARTEPSQVAERHQQSPGIAKADDFRRNRFPTA